MKDLHLFIKSNSINIKIQTDYEKNDLIFMPAKFPWSLWIFSCGTKLSVMEINEITILRLYH